MAKVRIVNVMLTALIVSVCMFAPATHAESNVASNHAQQVQGGIRVTAHKIAEKPSNTVTTPAEPQQFGRDTVYTTQPPKPSNPVLAGGLPVDEAGGAPIYAAQLTHPSGPVMTGDDLQAYGRDSVYLAVSPSAAPLLHLVGGRK